MALQQSEIRIDLSHEERDDLERLARSYAAPHRSVVRAQTILELARGQSISAVSRELGRDRKIVRKWQGGSSGNGCEGWRTFLAAGGQPVFPPELAAHLVKLACELPDRAGRSLSLWTCAEFARSLKQGRIVEGISPQSVQRILESHRLKPWRVHFWLSPKTPRDEPFRQQVLAIMDLYTRPLDPHERVLSPDEKTSLQPRTRSAPTRPPKPDLAAVR
jgi:hypothetical protein